MARPPLHNQHPYSLTQEQLRHDDAVHWYGEMTAFILWWSVIDFESGDVERCSVCYTPLGDVADVYKQSPESKCSGCFGTTFEGGFRAIVYRPALWSFSEGAEEVRRRGFTSSASCNIQTVSGIRIRDNDIAVRSDGTRWRLDAPRVKLITTGFGPNSVRNDLIGSVVTGNLDDETMPSYLPTINTTFLQTSGWNPELPYPEAPPDQINGSLI